MSRRKPKASQLLIDARNRKGKSNSKEEKLRKRILDLQKSMSRTKDGKKVTDEKDIAAGPAAAFPVKNREKKNRLKIKDD